jgi:hypothetical protein
LPHGKINEAVAYETDLSPITEPNFGDDRFNEE